MKWLVSYPRSGRNWLIAMLGHRLTGKPQNNRWLKDGGCPGLNATHDGAVFHRSKQAKRDPTRPPKSQYLAMDARYTDSEVFHLIRDPRDCSISHFIYYTQRERRRRRFGTDINTFLHSCWGLPYHMAFLNRWADLQHSCHTYVQLRYEDLAKDPITHFFSFLNFYTPDIRYPRTAVESTIRLVDLPCIRQMDVDGQMPGRVSYRKRKNNPLAGFCVHGRPRGWLNDPRIGLTEDTKQWMEEYISQHLSDIYAFYKENV